MFPMSFTSNGRCHFLETAIETAIEIDVANVVYWREWIWNKTLWAIATKRAIPKDRARLKTPTICLIRFLFEHQGGLLWLLEVTDHQGSRQVGMGDRRVHT